jgi:hypothetical protein
LWVKRRRSLGYATTVNIYFWKAKYLNLNICVTAIRVILNFFKIVDFVKNMEETNNAPVEESGSLVAQAVELKKKKKKKKVEEVPEPKSANTSENPEIENKSESIKKSHKKPSKSQELTTEITVPTHQTSEKLSEVVLKLRQKGGVVTKKFDLEITGRYFYNEFNVVARDVEESFKLVRCHLEGNDHSARFPDKETGLYDKIDPKVEYTVYGHPYHADQIWRPKNNNLNKRVLDIQKGVILKEGTLLKVLLFK